MGVKPISPHHPHYQHQHNHHRHHHQPLKYCDVINNIANGSGPEMWPEKYPIASQGKRQSPIDIRTGDCERCSPQHFPARRALEMEYPSHMDNLTLVNGGHGWRVDVPPEIAQKTLLTGGPLEGTYRLAQFHCHWGKNSSCGSEHTVDGKSYAAELHFVHWNTDKFSCFNDAAAADGGLAVLGVFLRSSPEANNELSKITSMLCEVAFKDQRVPLRHRIDIRKLMPDNKVYWTYPGSLTTPPLYESVTWIVFREPINCSEEQLQCMRTMRCHEKLNEILDDGTQNPDESLVLENFRPPQPLYDRIVRYVA